MNTPLSLQREVRPTEGLAVTWQPIPEAIRYGLIVGVIGAVAPPIVEIMRGSSREFALVGIPPRFTGAVDIGTPVGEERQFGLIAYRTDGTMVPVPGIRFYPARSAPRDREYHAVMPPPLERTSPAVAPAPAVDPWSALSPAAVGTAAQPPVDAWDVLEREARGLEHDQVASPPTPAREFEPMPSDSSSTETGIREERSVKLEPELPADARTLPCPAVAPQAHPDPWDILGGGHSEDVVSAVEAELPPSTPPAVDQDSPVPVVTAPISHENTDGHLDSGDVAIPAMTQAPTTIDANVLEAMPHGEVPLEASTHAPQAEEQRLTTSNQVAALPEPEPDEIVREQHVGHEMPHDEPGLKAETMSEAIISDILLPEAEEARAPIASVVGALEPDARLSEKAATTDLPMPEDSPPTQQLAPILPVDEQVSTAAVVVAVDWPSPSSQKTAEVTSVTAQSSDPDEANDPSSDHSQPPEVAEIIATMAKPADTTIPDAPPGFADMQLDAPATPITFRQAADLGPEPLRLSDQELDES
ncbi:MAG: hypothetical protein JWO42_1315, partial [Chloroflexi bacterium]|nr:hypothetical protein [Chloroflexota bacterium]